METPRGLLLTGVAAVSAALVLAVPTDGRSGHRTGIAGRVLDTTCRGPCVSDPAPHPYLGRDARIVIRRRGERRRAASTRAERGHFRVSVAPGRYLVRARFENPCWQGESRRVRVERGALTRVRLEVKNVCIR